MNIPQHAEWPELQVPLNLNGQRRISSVAESAPQTVVERGAQVIIATAEYPQEHLYLSILLRLHRYA